MTRGEEMMEALQTEAFVSFLISRLTIMVLVLGIVALLKYIF